MDVRRGVSSGLKKGGGGTYDEQHEILQHALEMAVPRNGNRAIDNRPHKGPDETRDRLRPLRHELQAEGQAIDVRAVVGDDAEGEDDEAEFAEGAEGGEEHGGEEAADSGIFVAVCVGGVDWVERGGRDCQAEHFGEAEGENEPCVCPRERLDARDAHGLINGIISRIARPAGAEAKNGSRERQDAAGLGAACVHVQVAEFAAVGEFAEDDEEDDEGGDPGPEFVVVHDFVAEDGDEPGRGGDDDDAGVAGDVAVDGVDELGADDDVHGGPADTGEDVEAGDC